MTGRLVRVLVLSAAFLSCATGKRDGPYQPAREADRNTEQARQLNAEAALVLELEPQRAEELLTQALTADLYFGPAHNNLGALYLRQDKLYEAAHEFEWARKLMPGSPEPRINLALTMERAGKNQEALEAFESALVLAPEFVPGLQGYAALRVRMGLEGQETDRLLDELSLRASEKPWRDWVDRVRVTRQNGRESKPRSDTP